MYTETFRDLCHGTDVISANKIKKNGFVLSKADGNWCGEGVYFYDIKAKAWWAADRKCRQIKEMTGKKIQSAVIFADIIDIDKEKIFDMRVHKDLCNFEEFVSRILSGKEVHIQEINDEHERIIQLRAMFIAYYTQTFQKKLVIGHFRQRVQPLYEHAIEFAQKLDMVFGIETIYCVKDNTILENIR